MMANRNRYSLRPGRKSVAQFAAAGLVILAVVGGGARASAPDTEAAVVQAAVDSGDTAWLLISSALVMLMTPALAFFYGGLVRRKNMLSVLMQCLMILCLISLQWVVFGYSLSFGPDKGGLIGSLDWAFLRGVGMTPNAEYAATVPHQVFMMFQMMFAVITPALIIGAFAERMKFSALCVFTLLWATFVYDPVAHWVWGVGGFMRQWGALDFAGGAVVHITAGMTALAAALVLGRRQGYPEGISPPHNLPLAVLGAGLLWFGWFGFNAGSALGSGGLAGSAFMCTHIAAATAGVTWALLDWYKHKKPTTLGMITGMVGGLVSITPAAGFVTPIGAICIGIGAGVIPWFAVTYIKAALGYDDTLDAFGVHGVGGIWGAIATGIFATKTVNPAGADGLLYGNPTLLWIQIKAVAVTMVYAFVVGVVLLKLVDAVMKLRVGEHEERVGLDLTMHREAAYTIID
ncbi:MAG TPA: ammonium transporter [Sedimentisphaerales bacterium]|nr:ammonium transporter [Sedimentisphaerales bacterium]